MTRYGLPMAVLLALAGCTSPQGLHTQTGFAPVANGELYYETAGRGPAVVMIHGGGMDRRMWDDQFELLARDFQVVRYDVRGHGKSPAATEPYADHRDLDALLAHLGIDRTHLVGLSLGGRIAIDYALANPTKVDRLVLSGPGLSGYVFSAAQGQRLSPLIQAARDEGPEAAADLWMQNPYMLPAAENPICAERVRQLTRENGSTWLLDYSLMRMLDPPAVNRLDEIKASTLVVVGDRDVKDIQLIVRRLVKKIPNVRKEVIPGAGHIVPMENPAEFNRLLLDFLKRGT